MIQQTIKDIEDYSGIYDKYAPALYGVILQHIPDRHLAGDILQKSFVKIWEDFHSYNVSKNTLFTFMLRTTIQECKNKIEVVENVSDFETKLYIVK